jgi:CubicO group peptidase (beta-lactamase class C family)
MNEATITINGHCDPRFDAVRAAFASNFEQGTEVGASVAVTLDGTSVVDLWAGSAADGNGAQPMTPWREDTIVNVYSTTKTMAGLCMLMIADRGLIDFDAPVANYWPEFAANGKEGVLVRHVMGHTSGLSGWDTPITATDLYAGTRSADLLAEQAPWWTPGDGSGYHAITLGSLQGEIVRRVTGQTIGQFFASEVATPLGADFHIGFGPEHDHRCGELVATGAALGDADLPANSLQVRTLANPRLTGEEPRQRAWRAAEIPAAGGFGNARSVGRVHSAMACGGSVDGVDLLSTAGLERVFDAQAHGIDRVLGTEIKFGMGFGLPTEVMPLPNPRSFFWGGWGGSLAVIDMDARMSVSYVMNKMYPTLEGDLRGAMLLLAAYGSLG